MRAREIIYFHYSDYYTRKLEKLIKIKRAEGNSFEVRILQAKLNRWLTAATGESVNRQVQCSLKNKIKDNKASGGREKLTLRNLNRLRKEKLVLIRLEDDRLRGIETMYGNKYTDK